MATQRQRIDALLEKIQSLPIDRIAEVEDYVDFLWQRVNQQQVVATNSEPLNFPVEAVGTWPADLSLRREDMYGDDGR